MLSDSELLTHNAENFHLNNIPDHHLPSVFLMMLYT